MVQIFTGRRRKGWNFQEGEKAMVIIRQCKVPLEKEAQLKIVFKWQKSQD